jgi:hypothetical protein
MDDARALDQTEASRSASLVVGFLHEGEEGAADGEAGVELAAADWKALLTAQNAGIPDLPTMAELTKSALVSVTISSNASPAKVDPEKAASRDRTFVIVAALIAALLLQGSDCL